MAAQCGGCASSLRIAKRSWVYGYDGLQRLKTADMGPLDASDPLIFAPGSTPRQTTWSLDLVGNWAATRRSRSRLDGKRRHRHAG
jgi:hypothetical protein